jgi:hypothetical protein
MGNPIDTATLMETSMNTFLQDAALQAWKRQLDAGFAPEGEAKITAKETMS